MPDFNLERAAGGCVAGIDEAGRGPLAGPVIAAAVILDPETLPGMLRDGIDDSKVLTKSRREELFAALRRYAHIGIGGASAAEIDRINILAATLRAMGRAVDALGIVPDLALIDGNRTPELACPAKAVVRGDQASLSIAAASIVAKVTRDHIMAALARRHPGFGWERNAGYGTAEHKQALTRLGVTPHHRKTFAPINKILSLS
ncbi:MAG: ribonuclease HII [Proteobacteria bacterium]|nr:ribonuclease HII [Pseudomonadota bacterium]MCH7633182.1 ribonuclease HII [Pseudomonadota bacterium]MCH8137752.1 ribonuclease HII [Pseudomonadota bacterium]MCZ6745181.1 ribonuclease HII [Alphaproteobacteria bacterium]